jgi:hypothetical protein
MRRVAGLILSALGAFLIVLALLVRFVVVGEAVKYPLNENQITTLQASNASYFSAAEVKELNGVSLTDTLSVQGNRAAGSSSTAVWQEFNYIWDSTNNLTVSYSQQQLAFDRRSGVLVKCCGAYIGTNKSPNVSGQGYVWPFNTQKKTYEVFNTTTMKAEPSAYSGTATVDGEATYKFVENDAPAQIGTLTVPGDLVGQPQNASVTLPEYYADVTTEYVDPITGAPVEGLSNQHLYLQNSSGGVALNLVKANFATTPATVASIVHTAKTDDNEIDILSFIVPVITGIVGVILLIIGLLLTLTSRREAEYEDEDEYSEATA